MGGDKPSFKEGYIGYMKGWSWEANCCSERGNNDEFLKEVIHVFKCVDSNI